MEKQKYIEEITSDIIQLLDKDYLLSNYKNQVFAWRLNASFNRTFKEEYLWNRAIFLTTNCCILLQNNSNYQTAINGLKTCAEIFEYLSELIDISEKYDKDYLLLLSALCYDLSGYQANGYCVASRISSFTLNSNYSEINLATDNNIIEQIKLILLKQIPFAIFKIKQSNEINLDFILFQKAIVQWYEYILKLKENNYLSDINDVYLYFLNHGNTYLSQLIFLLKTRLLEHEKRSIWSNLKQNEEIANNKYWQKYVKLLAQDYYSNNTIKDLPKRKSIFEFWTSQLRAIEAGLIELDENFVVQMPTSAGKTFIAELSILKYLLKYPQKKCIYIAPFRALTSEKEIELGENFSKLGFSVSSLSGSYEIDEFQNVIISETDVLVATPEKIDLLLRINPDFFTNISFIVVDEGHIVGDWSARATLLEFLLIRLKIKIPEIRTLFISAVMPSKNANEYALWLSGKENNVLRSLSFKESSIDDEWEPTRKLIGSFVWEGNSGNIIFKNIHTEDENKKNKKNAFIPNYLKAKEFGSNYILKNKKNETTAALAYKLSFEGSTLVFCAQPRQTEWIYNRILHIINLIDTLNVPDWFKSNENKQSFFYSKLWYGENYYITQAIKIGIGIHFGDMPEQVRNAVENDYRNGALRLLLSSNTVGQGLNFPIKNLIFYSLNIGFDNDTKKQINIQFRDFWNIVGRAGRAGKETEGKIIFVINSPTDERLFKKYTDKKNIEEANSLIFKVLNELLANRINKYEFSQFLSLLTETYLLDLMTEEIIGTEYEKEIEAIINNSLFKIQIENRKLETMVLKEGLKKIFKSFEKDTSIEQISTYKTTGFSFISNKTIDEFIETYKDELNAVVEADDYLKLIDYFLKLISNNEIDELSDIKLNQIVENPIDFKDIIKDWILGVTIQDLIFKWKGDVKNLHIFISKALYYLYPWGVTSFLNILSYKIKIKLNEFPVNIKNLSSYLKYGLNNPTSCLARSIGIKGREVANFLFEKSNSLEGKEFIKWLSNLSITEIDNFELSFYDKENIKNIALKLTPTSFRILPSSFEFKIKGTFYNENWKANSKLIKKGASLNLVRDFENEFDPYAIKLRYNDLILGFIPREYSKIISSEIDLNDTEYIVKVIEIIRQNEFNEIEVELKSEK